MSFFGRLTIFIIIMAALIMIIGLLPGIAHSAKLLDYENVAGLPLSETKTDPQYIGRANYTMMPRISNKFIQNADFNNAAELTRPGLDSFEAENLLAGYSIYV